MSTLLHQDVYESDLDQFVKNYGTDEDHAKFNELVDLAEKYDTTPSEETLDQLMCLTQYFEERIVQHQLGELE